MSPPLARSSWPCAVDPFAGTMMRAGLPTVTATAVVMTDRRREKTKTKTKTMTHDANRAAAVMDARYCRAGMPAVRAWRFRPDRAHDASPAGMAPPFGTPRR